MIIQEQMQANLAHFYMLLKQSDTVHYQDINGTEHEGQVHLIQPNEQKLLFSNSKNLVTNECSRLKLIQFKDLTYVKIQKPQIVEKSKSEKKSKTFVKWDQNVDESNLEDQPVKNFDQFEAIKKFGLEPTYDENSYTTKLTAPVSEDLKQYAEKQEQELKQDSSNKHVLEERNLKQLDDEEQAYSAVVREPQPIKFFNSNKLKEQAVKIAYLESLLQNIELIDDEPEFQMKVKPANPENTTKFKLQQTITTDVPKLMMTNFLNATEVFKWQNMQPDPLKNKKVKK